MRKNEPDLYVLQRNFQNGPAARLDQARLDLCRLRDNRPRPVLQALCTSTASVCHISLFWEIANESMQSGTSRAGLSFVGILENVTLGCVN